MSVSEDAEVNLRLLNQKLEVLHGDVGEMKAALRQLSDAITKLALVEERQAQATAAMERMWKGIANVEARVTALERLAPDGQRANVWIDRALMAIVGAVAMFIAKKAGLL